MSQGKKVTKVKKPQPGASGQQVKGGKVAQTKKGGKGGAAKGGAEKGGKGAKAVKKEREEGERESSPELYDPEDPTQEGGDTEGEEDELVPWSKAKQYIDQVRAEEKYEKAGGTSRVYEGKVGGGAGYTPLQELLQHQAL